MKRDYCIRQVVLLIIIFTFAISSVGQSTSALKLAGKISLPTLREGDFDHFAKDLKSNRVFLTAEANGAVVVFDATSNKVIHTIKGLDSPHALIYRDDIDKLF